MANTTLFASSRGNLLPAATALNNHNAIAYELTPKQKLAQYATTGCLSTTFYAGAEAQLATVLELVSSIDAQYIAKCAIYARENGAMKDMPALLLAALSMKSPALFKKAFPRIVDN